MSRKHHHELSRRERQIMDVIYQRGQASAAEVMQALPDPPSYSAVRALIGILERKGLLKHTQEGAKYIYAPTTSRNKVAQTALKRMVQTFFDGSVEKAVAALLNSSDRELSAEERSRLRTLIEETKKQGR